MNAAARCAVRRLFAGAMLLCVLWGAAAWAAPAKSILWVGNSRTYVGNLPEVYKALVLATSGQSVRADMIVEGGGYLRGRALDFSVKNRLAKQPYDYVLLQEHGSVLSCAADPARRLEGQCYDSVLAHNMLTKYVHNAHGKALLMGTANFGEDDEETVEPRLKGEAWVAFTAQMDGHIQLARAAWAGTHDEPTFAWLNVDGGHQGRDGLLLMAVLTYHQIEGKWPQAKALSITLRDYPGSAPFGADTLGAEQNTELPLSHYTVTAKRVARIIDIAKRTPVY